MYEFCPFQTPAGERCVLGNHGDSRHEVAPLSSAAVQAIERQEQMDTRMLGSERAVPETLSKEYIRSGVPGKIYTAKEPQAAVPVPETAPTVPVAEPEQVAPVTDSTPASPVTEAPAAPEEKDVAGA